MHFSTSNSPKPTIPNEPDTREVNTAPQPPLNSIIPGVIAPTKIEVDQEVDNLLSSLFQLHQRILNQTASNQAEPFKWILSDTISKPVYNGDEGITEVIVAHELLKSLSFPPHFATSLAEEIESAAQNETWSVSLRFRDELEAIITEKLLRKRIEDSPVGTIEAELEYEITKAHPLMDALNIKMRTVEPNFSAEGLARFVSIGYGRVFSNSLLIVPHIFNNGIGSSSNRKHTSPWHLASTNRMENVHSNDPAKYDTGFVQRECRDESGKSQIHLSPVISIDPRVLTNLIDVALSTNPSAANSVQGVVSGLSIIADWTIHDSTGHQIFTQDYRAAAIKLHTESCNQQNSPNRLGNFLSESREPQPLAIFLMRAEILGFVSKNSVINSEKPINALNEDIFAGFSHFGNVPEELFAELLHRSLIHDLLHAEDGDLFRDQLIKTGIKFLLDLRKFGDSFIELRANHESPEKRADVRNDYYLQEIVSVKLKHLALIALTRFGRLFQLDDSNLDLKYEISEHSGSWSFNTALDNLRLTPETYANYRFENLREKYRIERGARRDEDLRPFGPGSAFVQETLDRLSRNLIESGKNVLSVTGKDLILLTMIEHGPATTFWVHDYIPWEDSRFNVLEISARFWRIFSEHGKKLYPELANWIVARGRI